MIIVKNLYLFLSIEEILNKINLSTNINFPVKNDKLITKVYFIISESELMINFDFDGGKILTIAGFIALGLIICSILFNFTKIK